MRATIPGYAYGSDESAGSPVGAEELHRLKATVMFTAEDNQALRLAGEVLEDQVEDVLDVWYGFVADHPHLVAYFSSPDGDPIREYLDRVRPRFGQWILDTCRRPYDRSWLDYQEEIAQRHTHEKKNTTDGVDSVDNIPLATSSPSSTRSPPPCGTFSPGRDTTASAWRRCTEHGPRR